MWNSRPTCSCARSTQLLNSPLMGRLPPAPYIFLAGSSQSRLGSGRPLYHPDLRKTWKLDRRCMVAKPVVSLTLFLFVTEKQKKQAQRPHKTGKNGTQIWCNNDWPKNTTTTERKWTKLLYGTEVKWVEKSINSTPTIQYNHEPEL